MKVRPSDWASLNECKVRYKKTLDRRPQHITFPDGTRFRRLRSMRGEYFSVWVTANDSILVARSATKSRAVRTLCCYHDDKLMDIFNMTMDQLRDLITPQS